MKCFLIMPYGNLGDPQKKADWDALHELIREVTESVIAPDGLRLECIRGDHELNPGEIVSGIVRDLAESPLAIAVLTGHNANVFYELGVRHALANRTILMAERESDVPFDLRTQRMLLFSTQNLAATQQLRRQLSDTLRTIIAQSSDEPDNPVQRYLASRTKMVSQPQNAIDQVAALRDEMKEMRNALSDLIFSNRQNTARNEQTVTAEVSSVHKKAIQSFDEKRPTDTNDQSNSLDFAKENLIFENFVGAWLNKQTQSCAYAQMTDRGLEVVYCYSGDFEATGVYQNFQMAGSRIFARFRWINEPQIHGFTMLRVLGNDCLQGGWWYADSVAESTNGAIPELDEQHPEMFPIRWQKIPNKPFPEWAENWFRQPR